LKKKWVFVLTIIKGMKMYYSNENGRSMVEMLGVLAIIGVLSVGAIAGYSKAMFKYKINKTVQDINSIVGAVHTVFSPQGDYYGLSCSGRDVCKSVIPEHMTANGGIKDSFGTGMYVYNPGTWWNSSRNTANFSYATDYSINFDFYPIGKAECEALASQNWKDSSDFLAIQITQPYAVPSGLGAYCLGTYSGTYSTSGVYRCASAGNLTLSEINSACNNCDTTRTCAVSLLFK
jgi:type II secretory pathway pseudopilin PulG